MTCAGSLFLKEKKDDSTFQADEGTAASEYLEALLKGFTSPAAASNGVPFDEDIKFYTTPIAEDIKKRAASPVNCEQVINWMTRAGVLIKGKYDVSMIDHRGYLCIEDLKYGYGIVEVEENWQLLGYAIGEVIRLGRAFEKISLKIHQPRAHHEDGSSREWLITYQELLEYKERIEKRMEEIANGDRTLQTSEHCKYCDGAAESCPAFNRLFYRSLEVSTEFVKDSLTEAEISRQLDQIKRAEEVLKIKKDSIIELGISRIKNGKLIPNYVQAERYSNRKWNDNVTPEALKIMTGVDVMEKSFMSPSKAEKAGVPKELVDQLSKKRLIGTKLEKKDSTKIGNDIFGNTNPQVG